MCDCACVCHYTVYMLLVCGRCARVGAYVCKYVYMCVVFVLKDGIRI